MPLTPVNLVGSFIQTDDKTPCVASVTVQLSTVLYNAGDGKVVQNNPITAELDSAGHFSIPVVATDDPDTLPTGASYSITITFDNGDKLAAFAVAPRSVGAGGNVDLLSAIQPGPPGTGAFFIAVNRIGVPGGVAGPLDSGSKIPLAQIPTVPFTHYFDIFGTGADGDVVLPAGVTVLQRSMAYHNLTIPAGAILDPSSNLVTVSGTLAGAGNISSDGEDAVGHLAGLGGGGGDATRLMSSGFTGSVGDIGVGVSEGGDAASAQAGDGGAGAAGAGGVAILVPTPLKWNEGLQHTGLSGFMVLMVADYGNGANGGASGAGDGAAAKGGGGGGGAGMIALLAKHITFTGEITLRGGKGGNGEGVDAGGGGGGGGGLLWIITADASLATVSLISVAGGAHGLSGGGVGVNGTDGHAGILVETVGF